MQVQRISYQVRGFCRISDYAIRLSRMVSEQAKKRAAILAFWGKHGLLATTEAFKVSRRTLYLWKAKQKRAQGKLEGLNPGFRAPLRTRKRLWPLVIREEIRRLRTVHPNIGKEKIEILLKPFCVASAVSCPSSSTIGRLIADVPDKMRTFPQKVWHNGKIVQRKRRKVLRKPKDFKATRPGHCMALDTVERIVNGTRRYVITAVDIYSKFSLAFATNSHASRAAADFFFAIQQLFPYPIGHILTDNGSEFMKDFDLALRKTHKVHWHTYPRTPKMNAHCERFNRTIQEEFIDYHDRELIDVSTFNLKMADWLIWYNGTRPHHSLDLKSPVQFLQLHNQECNRWWPNTHALPK